MPQWEPTSRFMAPSIALLVTSAAARGKREGRATAGPSERGAARGERAWPAWARARSDLCRAWWAPSPTRHSPTLSPTPMNSASRSRLSFTVTVPARGRAAANRWARGQGWGGGAREQSSHQRGSCTDVPSPTVHVEAHGGRLAPQGQHAWPRLGLDCRRSGRADACCRQPAQSSQPRVPHSMWHGVSTAYCRRRISRRPAPSHLWVLGACRRASATASGRLNRAPCGVWTGLGPALAKRGDAMMAVCAWQPWCFRPARLPVPASMIPRPRRNQMYAVRDEMQRHPLYNTRNVAVRPRLEGLPLCTQGPATTPASPQWAPPPYPVGTQPGRAARCHVRAAAIVPPHPVRSRDLAPDGERVAPFFGAAHAHHAPRSSDLCPSTAACLSPRACTPSSISIAVC